MDKDSITIVYDNQLYDTAYNYGLCASYLKNVLLELARV